MRSASRGEISMLHRLVDPPRLIGCEADEDARLEGQRRIVPWAAYRALGPWVAHGTPMANPWAETTDPLTADLRDCDPRLASKTAVVLRAPPEAGTSAVQRRS